MWLFGLGRDQYRDSSAGEGQDTVVTSPETGPLPEPSSRPEGVREGQTNTRDEIKSSDSEAHKGRTTLSAVLINPQKDDTERNEAANQLGRSKYSEMTNDLIAVLNNPKEGERFRSFAVQHLWQQTRRTSNPDEREKIRTVLYRGLTDRHVKVRREALLALVRMDDPKGRETAVSWLLAPDAANVRDLAIRCIHKLDLREHIPTVRKYSRGPTNVIRIAAINTLSQWGDEESRLAFEEAAKSSNVRLQRAGKAAVARLDKRRAQSRVAP